jgi:signal transduction histidine kinase
LRELTNGIHPAELSDQGLVSAVRSLARRAPIPVTVIAGLPADTVRYATDIEESAFFLVSEALTNIFKHAQASQSTIRLTLTAGSLVVEITDDGIGLPDGFREGSGLTGLRDRVGAIGGDLEVINKSDVGTTVRAHLPAR